MKSIRLGVAGGVLLALVLACGLPPPPSPEEEARNDAISAEAARQAEEAERAAVDARTTALEGWRERWEAAEASAREGELATARDLFENSEPPSECAGARAECTAFEEHSVEPIRARLRPWVDYAEHADGFERRLEEVEEMEGEEVARYLVLQAILSDEDTVPEGCPDTICTEERAREIERQRRRARPMQRRGRRALERHAAQYRADKAARMDQALTGTRIDGSVRAEGRGNTQLVLRYVLCGRPVAEAMFLENLRTFEQEGYTWVGCRSSFRRYGWDLNPPPLEEQNVLDLSRLGTATPTAQEPAGEACPPARAGRFGVATASERVSRTSMGDEWPLTVESGCAYCVRSAAFFVHGGRTYGLNGIALSDLPEIDPIWAYDPAGDRMHRRCLASAAREGYPVSDCNRLRVNIGPLLNRALRLCER